MNKFERTKFEQESRGVSLARAVEAAETPKETQEAIAEFLNYFTNELKINLQQDVNALYQEMQKNKFLVRLESLSKILAAIEKGAPIPVGGENDHYANAVIPENEGLRIAFAEGEAPGPIRLLVGFDFRSAIGFDPKGLEVHEIDLDELDPRNQVKRAAFCRHVKGNLNPEQIKYLILRIPKNLFPKNMITEEDKKYGQFVFRGAELKLGKVAQKAA